MFDSGLRRSDLEQALGDAFLSAIPNDYAWCARRSIAACRSTRSSPATRSPLQLKKLVLPIRPPPRRPADGSGRAAA